MCTNQIKEFNTTRPCWFPVNPSSPFELCSRCDFYKVDEVLNEISSHPELLTNPAFCTLCVMPNHRTSLLHAFVSLYEMNHELFTEFLKNVSTEKLLNDINHQIYTHGPSNRCKFYQYILKTRQWNRDVRYTDLPWNCWSCLAFIHRQHDCLGCQCAFTKGILRNTHHYSEESKHHVLDVMTSMTLRNKEHTARLLFDRFRACLNNEAKAQTALVEFLTQPALLSTLFLASSTEFVPSTWRHTLTRSYLQHEALKAVRKKNWVFKEDLMRTTWHPDRLFLWCFDTEELNEFSYTATASE